MGHFDPLTFGLDYWNWRTPGDKILGNKYFSVHPELAFKTDPKPATHQTRN